MNKLMIAVLLMPLLFSCKKNTDLSISKAQLQVTPLNGLSFPAGSEAGFDVTGGGTAAIARLKVEEEYTGRAKRTLMDSTVNPSKLNFTTVYNYLIPDIAKKGDQAKLTFTAFDANGNATTQVQTVQVSASRPLLSVSGGKTTVQLSETVNFTVDITSVEPNLSALEVKESLKGAVATTKFDTAFNSLETVHFSYPYKVPSGLQSGDQIILVFYATNKDNVQSLKSFNMKVQ